MQDATFTWYLARLVTHVTEAHTQVAELLFEFAGATLVITLPQGQVLWRTNQEGSLELAKAGSFYLLKEGKKVFEILTVKLLCVFCN
jgi:hypothetical protein